MTAGRFRFDRFSLDPADRQLRLDDAPVALNARYLDALVLLVREQGRLVSKDRFLDEVWQGVPVTDEALTQCVRTLRKQLGDDAGRPRFIETVPKHGYRFVAPVEWIEPPSPSAASPEPPPQAPTADRWRQILTLTAAGTAGGGVAGVVGGLIYGFIGASGPPEPGVAAFSVLLVLVCITLLIALVGGAGVAFGTAAAGFAPGRLNPLAILGGAAGGLVVGAFAKLLGVDAFNLLFGQSPGDITGAPEGALLGAAIGFGAWFGARGPICVKRGLAAAALAGAVVGAAIPPLGGRLMIGSLYLLAHRFPNSRLKLDQIGALFGEAGFGPLAQSVTGALEGALFCAGVAGAMVLAARSPVRRASGASSAPRGAG